MQFLLSLLIGFIFFLAAFLGGVFMYLRFSKGRYVTGKEIPAEKKAVVKQRYILTVIALIALGVYFGMVFDYKPFFAESSDAWKTTDNKTMAYVMMQNFVKENLKSPGSAKFEWITEPDCKITKNEFDYTISSWVDSQNAFGATVRTRFIGIVRQTNKDNWRLMALEFKE